MQLIQLWSQNKAEDVWELSGPFSNGILLPYLLPLRFEMQLCMLITLHYYVGNSLRGYTPLSEAEMHRNVLPSIQGIQNTYEATNSAIHLQSNSSTQHDASA